MAAKKSNSLLDIQSKKKQRSIFHHCAFPLDCIASETVFITLIVHLVPELATQRDSQQNCSCQEKRETAKVFGEVAQGAEFGERDAAHAAARPADLTPQAAQLRGTSILNTMENDEGATPSMYLTLCVRIFLNLTVYSRQSRWDYVGCLPQRPRWRSRGSLNDKGGPTGRQLYWQYWWHRFALCVSILIFDI